MGRLVEVPYEHKNNWCGTSCCIAGYVFSQEVAFNPDEHDHNFNGFGDVESVAAKALGLEEKVAERLFYIQDRGGFQYEGDWGDVDATHAAQAVRNVIEHGEPLWENILEFYEYEGDY